LRRAFSTRIAAWPGRPPRRSGRGRPTGPPCPCRAVAGRPRGPGPWAPAAAPAPPGPGGTPPAGAGRRRPAAGTVMQSCPTERK
jgi:hypothetical protein